MADEVNTVPFDAVTADLSGLTVIEASAGTGKTHAIQKLVSRLVLTGVPMPRMLVMSYTNAAAAELSQRIRSELQQSLEACPAADARSRLLLQQALADFDRACISTIHAFCQRMLQEHPMQAGVHGMQGWTLQTDETEARQRACGDAWAALVAADAVLAGMVRKFESVTAGLGGALSRRAVRERVQAADFHSKQLVAVEAMRALGDTQVAATLLAIKANFNKGAREPAEVLIASVSAGRLPGEEVCRACEKLLDDAVVQDSIPATAAKCAAANAVVASPGWRSLRGLLEALRDAAGELSQSALDTVVRDALRRLLAHRAATRTLVFDDLITRLRDAVLDDSGAMTRALRERFEVVIVDEVQDTDPVQASILQRAFAESPTHRLILVGDPKQSIYAFRNADVDSYVALRNRCTKPWYCLDVSWRSDPALIHGVQHLYAVEQPFLRADIPAMQVRSAYDASRIHGPAGNPPGLALHVTDSTDPNDMLQMTAHAIAAELRAGWQIDERKEDGTTYRRPLRPGDIAVLCHKHYQGRAVADALQALGVLVIVMDQQQVWSGAAAADVLRLLAAMSRPWDRASALGALAGRCTGLCARDALESPDKWVQALRDAGERVGTQGIGAALRALVMRGVPAHGRAGMLACAEGERLATDFDHVVEELERAQCDGVGTVHALANWLSQRVHDTAGGEESLCRSIGGVDAVQVMTLHGSKGLTFGVVWLPTFMLPSKKDSDAAEARRLLYVGLTRARFVTRAVWMPEADAAASPLAQLLHARTDETLEDAVATTAARLQAADAANDLHALASTSGGSVAVMPLDPGSVPAVDAAKPVELAQARPMPAIADRSVTLSFTSLSSVKHHANGDREERDVDAGATPLQQGPREPVTIMDATLRDVGPGGAALGTLVHDALAEPAAFAALAPFADIAPLHAALRQNAVGLPVKSDAALLGLAQALQRALAAPTGHAGIPSVAEVALSPQRCLRELNVALPWHGAPAKLAEIMRAESAPWSDRVAAALTRGDARQRLGALVGSIDLAVESGGQWFIYDYKTNFVGDHAADYAPNALHRAMADELYPLQAALYSVILTRWLASRGWKSAAKPVIGGVAYLFLRGMGPDSGSQGTWTWQPSLKLLQAFDTILPPVHSGVQA
jgi:exodeoxyribonuclease V beta subunit